MILKFSHKQLAIELYVPLGLALAQKSKRRFITEADEEQDQVFCDQENR